MILNGILLSAFFIYERFLEPGSELDPERIELKISGSAPDTASYVPDSLFAFDPNRLSLEGWKALGLSEQEASVIINYRESGGLFYSEEDLLKVYSVQKEEVRAWRDSLRFPEPTSEEEAKGERDRENNSQEKKRKEQEKKKEEELFPFDPNRLAKEGWTRLGLSSEQAGVVIAYRKAGGKFWKASDLLELYVVDTSLYRKWKPYVRIDREALQVPVDLADEERLKSLPGIGKIRARRIIKYRRALGGFFQKEQLREVYGVPDSLWNRLMGKVKVEGHAVEPIPLDTSASRLMEHPYIDPSTAEAIVEHQQRYGPFEKKSELRRLDLFGAQEYRKIAPYLELSSHE